MRHFGREEQSLATIFHRDSGVHVDHYPVPPSSPAQWADKQDPPPTATIDALLLRQNAHELVMGCEGCWWELDEGARSQDRHARQNAEPVMTEPSDDVVVFESVDGVEEVGAPADRLVVAGSESNLMSELDGPPRLRHRRWPGVGQGFGPSQPDL